MEQNRSIIGMETLYGGNYSLKDIRDRDIDFETYQEWPSEIGTGRSNMMRLRPGLLLGIGSYRLNQYIEYSVEYTAENTPVFFGYALSGSIAFTFQSEKHIQFLNYRSGYSLVSYLPGGRCFSSLPVGINVRSVGIGIDPGLLQGWMAEDFPLMSTGLHAVLNGSRQPYCQISNIPPETHVILNQIMTCPYRGALKRLYLESKAVELITCTIAPLAGSALKCDALVTARDTDYIHEAEFLLKVNLEKPPSLPELARQVGVNKTKLNNGFRKVFGTSVFDHLRILRLERARELLENGHKSVTEVAFEVGYAHPENFTRAFKNHFRTSPKDHLD